MFSLQDDLGLLVCSFSRDGRYIVAGSNDCSCYVWSWDTPSCSLQQPEDSTPPRGDPLPSISEQCALRSTAAPGTPGAATGLAGSVSAAAASEDGRPAATGGAASPAGAELAAVADRESPEPPACPSPGRAARAAAAQAQADYVAAQAGALAAEAAAPLAASVPNSWAAPQEVCRLEGHKNDVMLLSFSPDSQAIATGSKDGFLRVAHHPLPRRLSSPHQAFVF